jgi:hypothetical protein
VRVTCQVYNEEWVFSEETGKVVFCSTLYPQHLVGGQGSTEMNKGVNA